MENRAWHYMSGQLKAVAEKVASGQRLNPSDALMLYREAGLGLLGVLAHNRKVQLHGQRVFFVKNAHLELTNHCVYNCLFCSYKHSREHDAWLMGKDEVRQKLIALSRTSISEIHLTSGVHPDWDLKYYCEIIALVRDLLPGVHIKAFSAVELHYMFGVSGVDPKEGLERLQSFGLQSIPGGGAEIFDELLRKQICPDKVDHRGWLDIHRAAHQLGIASNATMLYGHLETYEQRIDHMLRLRNLQDETGGFNAFIPLKFKNKNNKLSGVSEVSLVEDLRNYAVARLFLDNFSHLKAYWPMLGKGNSQTALSFGVDDLDGTIEDTTRIYAMAGATDEKPAMGVQDMKNLIAAARCMPVERDAVYREIVR